MRCSSSRSVSTARTPRAAAAARAPVVLPAPMKPMKTNTGEFRPSVIGQSAPSADVGEGAAADLRATLPLPPDALLIRRERAANIVDVVAAELVAVGAGEHDRQHRLAHDASRGDDAGVGALAQRLRRLLGGDVDRA